MLLDSVDSCPKGDLGWISSEMTDHDSDGCQDAVEIKMMTMMVFTIRRCLSYG